MKFNVKRKIIRAKQELIKELLYSQPTLKPDKLLFDHIPKCGGATLTAYLERHYPKRKTYTVDGSNASVDKFKNMSESKRYGYDLVKGHLAHQLIDFVHPECLKVTVLREPVDRIVSHYYYAKRRSTHYLHMKINRLEMTLEDYVSSDISGGELRNFYTTHFSGLELEDAEENPEESIAKAVDVLLKRYDVVGFLDNFSPFVEMLRNKVNLIHKYENDRVNVTQNRPSLNNVEGSTLRKIEQRNQLDIDMYRRIRDAIGS